MAVQISKHGTSKWTFCNFIFALIISVVICNPPPYHRGPIYYKRHNGNRNHRPFEPIQENVSQNPGEPYSPPQTKKAISIMKTDIPRVIGVSEISFGHVPSNDNEGLKLVDEVIRSGSSTTSHGIQLVGGDGYPFPEDKPEKFPVNSPCPEGFGIHKESGLCFQFQHSSEIESRCGPRMTFYKSVTNPAFGECDCKVDYFRPKVYYNPSQSQKGTCYWLFDQGPCLQNEWLILNDNGTPICSKRSCPQNSPTDWSENPSETDKKKYWFRYEGKCYHSDSKGFCENSEHKIFLYFDEKDSRPGYKTKCKTINGQIKNIGTGGTTLPCRPGHRSTVNGECRRTVQYE